MLKFFLILILVFYLIYRLGGFFLRVLFTNAFQQQQRQYQSQQRPNQNGHSKTPPNSNVRVDYVPKETGKGQAEKKEFNGGQYVDYEEVK